MVFHPELQPTLVCEGASVAQPDCKWWKEPDAWASKGYKMKGQCMACGCNLRLCLRECGDQSKGQKRRHVKPHKLVHFWVTRVERHSWHLGGQSGSQGTWTRCHINNWGSLEWIQEDLETGLGVSHHIFEGMSHEVGSHEFLYISEGTIKIQGRK